MVAALRVKVKSLAEEARIIRHEECRAEAAWHPELRQSLWRHRTWDVRREQRAALLAYAFIRGRSYAEVERRTRSAPDLTRLKQLVEKYGTPVIGFPKFKCPDGALEAWVAGTLVRHPFGPTPAGA